MIEIIIIAIFSFTLFSFLAYFSIRSRHLSIQLIDSKKAIAILQEIVDSTKADLIQTKQKYENESKTLNSLQDFNNKILQENNNLKQEITETRATLDSTVKEEVDKARADSIKRQRSILKGQATEHLAPYINSEYNPKDYKFIGDPIDYVIYEGLSEIKDKDDELVKIIFMDIKTGKSNLNRVQRAIKKCIQDGKVEFQVYRPEKETQESDETD